jgi:hypothetical protein
MRPSLSAERLAGINRISDAGAAEIAPEALIELGYAPLAVRAMHPWPLAAEVRPGPGNLNALRWTVSQFEQNDVSSDAH